MSRETLLKELRVYWNEKNVPNISDTNAHFLRDIINIKNAKNILEIGTANWFSTIHLWIQAEKNNGSVTSIDFSKYTYEMAQENINRAELEKTVTLLFWNALDLIPSLDSSFDFIFIDGMMKSSVDFIKIVWEKTQTWWIIILDDVIKFKNKMTGLDHFLEINKIKYNILPLDIDDGIMMIIKEDITLI